MVVDRDGKVNKLFLRWRGEIKEAIVKYRLLKFKTTCTYHMMAYILHCEREFTCCVIMIVYLSCHIFTHMRHMPRDLILLS